MAQLAITLFGPPRIEIDNQQVRISRRKAMALLAYLAVSGQAHSREFLATLLWPESSQRRSGASLRSALWSLNKTPLADWLRVEGETAVLPAADSLMIDVVRFRRLLAKPPDHDHPATMVCAGCVDDVTAAVSIYQDDFMAGFTLSDAPAFDEWQFFQANALQASLATALECLLKFHSAARNLERAIVYGRCFAALDPLHEPAQQTLIQLYTQTGQQAAALRQYQIYQETLAAELDIEPSETMTALYAQIRKSPRDENRPSNIVSKKTPVAPPHNLPPEPTTLVGREEELRRVNAFLENPRTRLITITGPGGIGKTRLALAAAAGELSKATFADGVYFVSLTPVVAPQAMQSRIADTVGYPLQSDGRTSAQQLLDYFRHKAMLLVLDNFEHLLAGAAFIGELLQQAAQVTVLAASRERLNLYEEQQFVLGGLAIPDEPSAVTSSDYPAAALFLQSARRRRPDFAIAPADLRYLAAICRLVEGMPLGLELAAAWTEILSLREIATEIQQNLDFLETALRNVPDRHRSMRAVFDASWQRLSETEQRVYAQLSVFRGGFTLAAAQAVTGASLRIVASLVSQSLLRPSAGGERYDIHELLRQYTAVKLEESETGEFSARERHTTYYCAFLQEREADMKGARQQLALSEIEADLENVGTAWRWAVAQQRLVQMEQALVPLVLYYAWNGRMREGRALCHLAVDSLTRPQDTGDEVSRSRLLLRLHTWQSRFDLTSANYKAAEQSLQQAQAILNTSIQTGNETQADKAFLLLQLSEAANRETFGGDALALNEQSLALYRAIDDDWGIIQALAELGAKHQSLGNYDLAVALQRECLTISKQLQDPRSIAMAYSSLGHCILFVGELETSERYLRHSLALFRELNSRAGQRLPLLILGITLLFAGRFEDSIDSLEACWAIHRELGMPHEPASANVGLVRAKINLGRYEEARRLAEADLIRYRALKHKWYIAFTLFNLGRIALVEGDIIQGRDRFQESAAMLLEMDDRPLVPDVLFCQALVNRLLGKRQEAIRSITKALKIAVGSSRLNPMRFELPAMALLLLDTRETERAVELYAAALQSPYIANSIWFETIVGRQIAAAAAHLPPNVVAAAKARGQARDLWATAQALLSDLEPAGTQVTK